MQASSLPLAVKVVFLFAQAMVDARCPDTKDHTHTASPTMIEQGFGILNIIHYQLLFL